MRRSALLCAGVVMAGIMAMLCGCGRRGTTVTMAGSSAFLPFAEKLAEEFMGQHPDVNVTVQGGGSAVGIQSANSGAAQIGMADMVALPPEAAGLTSVIAARDGIAVVVNPANTVADLTMEQIRGIFNGSIRNWSEVGGWDKPVTVVSRESGSGTRTSFEQVVQGISLTPDAIIQDSNGTVRETVANDANAVGYLSHGLLNDKIRATTIDGLECTTDEILGGRYKLVRPVFLLTRGEPAGAVKDLIDYIVSPAGQELIQSSGLLPAR